MKIVDTRAGPVVIKRTEAKEGQVYGFGELFFIYLATDVFACLNDGHVRHPSAMPEYLDVINAEVVIK